MATKSDKFNHTLWLLKFENLSKTLLSFVNEFKAALAIYKDIEIIYIGRCNAPIMKSQQTVLPTQYYDMVMVTKNDITSFVSSAAYKQIMNKYPILYQTHIPFKIYPIPKVYGMIAATGQFISRLLGYVVPFDPTFGFFPPYPFKNGSYDFFNKLQENGIKGADGLSHDHLMKLIAVKDQPFFMLNLMQVTNKKSDRKYSGKVAPLVHAVGGRARIRGKGEKHWNDIIFVYYPNTKQVWDMISSTNYQTMYGDKADSVSDMLIVPTFPIYCHPQYAYSNINSKL